MLPAALLVASCTTEPPATGGGTPAPAGNAPAGGSPSGGTAETAKFESPRKADGPLKIQIITNGISPFWDPMAVGMKKAADELGCQAEWAGPQNSEVGAQKQLVESALAKEVDGIAISCIEPEATIPIIKSILDKGIPVITFDADSPNSGRLCYIGTNNFNAGKEAGKFATEIMPEGGKVMGFVGNISAANARERRDGFVEAIKGSKVELVDVLDDNKDPSRARRNVEDAIAKHADLKGLLGLFSYNGPQIAQAIKGNKELRSKFKVISFDAEPVTLQELEAGNIDGTVVQKPYDFGYLSTKLLYLINRKGWSEAKKEMKIPDNGLYDTGVQVVTPQNLKQYKDDLAKLGVKSS
jgi:ribose transport system substrate-binding protein